MLESFQEARDREDHMTQGGTRGCLSGLGVLTPPEVLGKGVPFGVSKHEIKQNPGNTPRAESNPQSGETTAKGTSLIGVGWECEPERQ